MLLKWPHQPGQNALQEYESDTPQLSKFNNKLKYSRRRGKKELGRIASSIWYRLFKQLDSDISSAVTHQIDNGFPLQNNNPQEINFHGSYS